MYTTLELLKNDYQKKLKAIIYFIEHNDVNDPKFSNLMEGAYDELYTAEDKYNQALNAIANRL